MITLPYDKLLADCRDARLLSTADTIDPGTLRRLLCDADLMPAILGGPSEVLDVGRTQRLVTPAIRAALEFRDGGCVFPGCTTPARDCEAHHIIPWRLCGPTALSNLVLLCTHHHGTIEPSHNPDADRWKVRLRTDSVPEIIPPLRVDPSQTTTTPHPLPHPTHTGRRSVSPATSSPTKGRAASYCARPYRRSPASPRPGTM